MTQMNIASRPSMGSAQVIDCSSLDGLAQALREVRGDVTVCIIQSITSFLVAAVDTGSIFGSIDPVLAEFNTTLRSFAAAKNSVQLLVAPPTFRPQPHWYREHLAEVAHQFSSVLSDRRPRNLHLMTSSVVQDLCPDGVHLTPVAGLHYLLHLFDDGQRIIESLTAKGELDPNYFIVVYVSAWLHALSFLCLLHFQQFLLISHPM